MMEPGIAEGKDGADISDAADTSVVADVAGLAHQIKGAAASIGALKLSESCNELEHAARSGKARDLARLHELLQVELAAVLDFIEARKSH